MSRFWPLEPGTYELTSPFGMRAGVMHWGQDFAAAEGTRIYAAQSGVIQYIGPATGFGQWIVIDHPTEAGSGATVYGHMANAFATGLAQGDQVTAGQFIAYVGNNGDSSGPHLHFEVHPTSWQAGSQIDPLPWLRGALEPPASDKKEVPTVTDTLYADVSQYQIPVDDSYPYRVIAIRSNDGNRFPDDNWSANYGWCKRRIDEGALDFFIVWFVWRENWEETVDLMKSMVGDPHPRMAVMIDVETWSDADGKIAGDQSDGINGAYQSIAGWLGDSRRVIGYGNTGDLNTLWPSKPEGIRLVIASYGSNPDYPGKIAHQYTNGTDQGDGPELPFTCPPFGPCCMDSADGYSVSEFAAALGIDVGLPMPVADLLTVQGAVAAPGVNCVVVAKPDTDAQWSAAQQLVRNNWSVSQLTPDIDDNHLVLTKTFPSSHSATAAVASLLPSVNPTGAWACQQQQILESAPQADDSTEHMYIASRDDLPIKITGVLDKAKLDLAGANDALSGATPSPDSVGTHDRFTDKELFSQIPKTQKEQLAEAILRSRYGLLSPANQLNSEKKRLAVVEADLRTARALTTGIQRWNLMAKLAPYFLLLTILIAAGIVYLAFLLTSRSAINGYEFAATIFLAAIFAISPATLLLLERPLRNLENAKAPWEAESADADESKSSLSGASSPKAAG